MKILSGRDQEAALIYLSGMLKATKPLIDTREKEWNDTDGVLQERYLLITEYAMLIADKIKGDKGCEMLEEYLKE